LQNERAIAEFLTDTQLAMAIGSVFGSEAKETLRAQWSQIVGNS
jgi:hypothetical protein